MGPGAGFDMVPRLSTGSVDRGNWRSFIKIIKERYQNDDLVEVKPNYILFKAGDNPMLPFECHKLLRFGSQISGSHAERIEDYIDTVTRVAEVRFGSRVRSWHGCPDELTSYSRQDVHDSFESYEQVCSAAPSMVRWEF
jgi:hypothetical protein